MPPDKAPPARRALGNLSINQHGNATAAPAAAAKGTVSQTLKKKAATKPSQGSAGAAAAAAAAAALMPAAAPPPQADAKEKKEQQAKKVKVSKKDREEYATIEADVEALEVAAVAAQAALDEAKGLKMNEMLDLASAATNARALADKKMERYLELEELMEQAGLA